MSAHTPGPWEANSKIGGWQIDAAMDAVATTVFCYAPETEANAHLIAAAPDLLAAATHGLRQCERLIDEFYGAASSSHQGLMRSLDPIRAALAKAEGRS